MFTARYELGLYIKQSALRLLKAKGKYDYTCVTVKSDREII